MEPAARNYYPPGHLLVSDAERDLALAELSRARQDGRITADEFEQRSAQVLSARTGKELTAPLADLPPDQAPAARTAAVERPRPARASRVVIGAAVGATCFGFVAAMNALATGPTLAQRELLRALAARQGVSIPLPPAQGFDWSGTITPAVIAMLFVVVLIVVRVTRANRRS